MKSFSKSILMKTKALFSKKNKKDDEFTMLITIQSNHVISSDVLERIEKQINDITTYEYDKVKEKD